jgi:uncharacterized protein YlxP (DUF503 family)
LSKLSGLPCFSEEIIWHEAGGEAGMVIGVLKIVLSIDDAFSLKEKRHIVKSVIERIKTRFNASAAEVGLNDVWKSAVIGVACVTNEASHADSMLANIVNFVENDGRAFVVDLSTEIIHID